MKRLKKFSYFEPASVKEAVETLTEAEAVIMSGPLDDERMRKAAKAAADEVTPITDLRCSASYRKEMVKVLTYRALMESLQKATGGIPN